MGRRKKGNYRFCQKTNIKSEVEEILFGYERFSLSENPDIFRIIENANWDGLEKLNEHKMPMGEFSRVDLIVEVLFEIRYWVGELNILLGEDKVCKQGLLKSIFDMGGVLDGISEAIDKINEAGIFVDKCKCNDLSGLFFDSVGVFKVNNNRKFAYFLSELNRNGIIIDCWRDLIEKKLFLLFPKRKTNKK